MSFLGQLRLQLWTSISLLVLVAQVGCAARGVPVQAAPATLPVSPEKCAEFAQKEVEATETLGSAAWVLLYPPWFVIFAGPVLWKLHGIRKTVYETEMKACLEPVILATKLGPEHPDIAQSLQHLADRYRTSGRYESRYGTPVRGVEPGPLVAEAEPLYKQALAIRDKTLGPEHPAMAGSLSGLARLYVLQGRHAEAEPLLQRLLTIQEKAFGSDHQDLTTTLEDYASLLRKGNRESEADQMVARANAIRAKHEPAAPATPAVHTSIWTGTCPQVVMTALEELNVRANMAAGRAEVDAAYCELDARLKYVSIKAVDGSRVFWEPKDNEASDLFTHLLPLLVSGP